MVLVITGFIINQRYAGVTWSDRYLNYLAGIIWSGTLDWSEGKKEHQPIGGALSLFGVLINLMFVPSRRDHIEEQVSW